MRVSGSEIPKGEAVTAYALPFRFLHAVSPLSQGAPLDFEVLLKSPVTDAAVRNLDSLVTTFYMLASTGALGGNAVAPPESGVGYPSRRERDEMSIKWDFPSTNVAQAAWPILAQLILVGATETPVEQVRAASGSGDLLLLKEDPSVTDWYPAMWPTLPFELSLSEEIGKSAMLAIEFSQKLTAAQRKAIQVELLTWAVATKIGSYGIAPIPPERCDFTFDEQITFFEAGLELGVENIKCHPAAFHGMVNVCIKIARNIVPIRSLAFE